MISNIKRYKNTINILKGKALESNQCRNNKITLVTYVFLDDSFYKYRFESRVHIPVDYKKVIAEECDDGNIYIGFRLDGVLDLEINEENIEEFVINRAFKSSLDNDVKRDIGISYEEYSRNPNLIRTTKPFLKILSYLENMKVEAVLKDGEFPKLKNRHMIPLYIINIKRRMVEYFGVGCPETYRKYRDSTDLSEVMSISRTEACLPKTLVAIHIEDNGSNTAHNI